MQGNEVLNTQRDEQNTKILNTQQSNRHLNTIQQEIMPEIPLLSSTNQKQILINQEIVLNDQGKLQLISNVNQQTTIEMKQTANEEALIQIMELDKIKHQLMINKVKRRFKSIIEDLENRRFKQIGQKQFNMINDWASSFMFYNQNKQLLQISKIRGFIQGKQKSFVKYLEQLNKKYPPLNPGHIICTLTDLLTLILSLLLIFQYSIQMGFQFNLQNSMTFSISSKLGLIIFILQIFINLNVGFYEKGGIIMDRQRIYNNYKIAMIEDIFSLTGLIYNLFDQSDSLIVWIFESFFLLKLLSINQKQKKFKDFILYQYGQPPFYILLKMFCKLMWYCHWIGNPIIQYNLFSLFFCSQFLGLCWHSVNIIEINYYGEVNTWLQLQFIADQVWYIRYTYSFYWATMTIITGGVMPSTFIEVVVTIILMFPTAALFAYIINEVGQLISQMTKDTKDYDQDLEEINKYMRKKNVGTHMQKRVINYLENIYHGKSEKKTNEEVHKILQKFPQNLKEDLNREICIKILSSNPIFKQNFSAKTIESCMKIVEEQYFMPGDIVVNMNSHEDICLFMIISGQVEIGLGMNKPGRDTIFASVPAGFCFGIQSFFSGLAQNFQAKSLTFTSIYRIKRVDFQKLIYEDVQAFEKFCMIRDQLITTNMCPKVYDQCKLCGKKNDHNDMICNLVHFHPYKRKRINVIKRNLYGNQLRTQYSRKKKKRYHVIESLHILQDKIEFLLQDDDIIQTLQNLYYDDNSSISECSVYESDEQQNIIDDQLNEFEISNNKQQQQEDKPTNLEMLEFNNIFTKLPLTDSLVDLTSSNQNNKNNKIDENNSGGKNSNTINEIILFEQSQNQDDSDNQNQEKLKLKIDYLENEKEDHNFKQQSAKHITINRIAKHQDKHKTVISPGKYPIGHQKRVNFLKNGGQTPKSATPSQRQNIINNYIQNKELTNAQSNFKQNKQKIQFEDQLQENQQQIQEQDQDDKQQDQYVQHNQVQQQQNILTKRRQSQEINKLLTENMNFQRRNGVQVINQCNQKANQMNELNTFSDFTQANLVTQQKVEINSYHNPQIDLIQQEFERKRSFTTYFPKQNLSEILLILAKNQKNIYLRQIFNNQEKNKNKKNIMKKNFMTISALSRSNKKIKSGFGKGSITNIEKQ